MGRSEFNCVRNFVSKLFHPQNIVPIGGEVKYEMMSRSQKLMLDVGVIRQAGNGSFYLLPLGERSLKKLIGIVDAEMSEIGAQKIILPSLTSAKLWRKTGRWDSAADELFTLKDRHGKDFVLSPTHEEAVADLLASLNQPSYKQFPLRLYQITSKFRDEMKPRFGLLRAKEFMMKDLYSFDVTLEKAQESYEAVTLAYFNVFRRIGIKFVQVAGSVGLTGGSLSHEFHFPATVGEDQLFICDNCGQGTNSEVLAVVDGIREPHVQSSHCLFCGHSSVREMRGIEVGHTFLLGTKYSEPLQAHFLQPDGKIAPLQMGCYGLGMTRILAAAVEVLCEPSGIRWPLALAPFKICIIPPKIGSKESAASGLIEHLCNKLAQIPCLIEDVIVDDRLNMTVGKRLRDASRIGYPFVVISGKRSVELDPYLELHDFLSNQQLFLPPVQVLQYLHDNALTL